MNKSRRYFDEFDYPLMASTKSDQKVDRYKHRGSARDTSLLIDPQESQTNYLTLSTNTYNTS